MSPFGRMLAFGIFTDQLKVNVDNLLQQARKALALVAF